MFIRQTIYNNYISYIKEHEVLRAAVKSKSLGQFICCPNGFNADFLYNYGLSIEPFGDCKQVKGLWVFCIS